MDDFSILEFQGQKGQKGRSDSYNYKLAHLDVKSSKHAFPTFKGSFYTTQKANLDGEVADNHLKGQHRPSRPKNEGKGHNSLRQDESIYKNQIVLFYKIS